MHYIFPAPFSYAEKDGTFTFKDKVYLTIPESFSNTDFKKLAPELWKSFTANKCTLEIIKNPSLHTTAYVSNTRQAVIQNSRTDFEYEIDCTQYKKTKKTKLPQTVGRSLR